MPTTSTDKLFEKIYQDDPLRLVPVTSERLQSLLAAERTLQWLDYTHKPWCEFWKPPIGKIQITEAIKAIKRYFFIRDSDNWGDDSKGETMDDTWEALCEAAPDEFDKIIDSRIAKNT